MRAEVWKALGVKDRDVLVCILARVHNYEAPQRLELAITCTSSVCVCVCVH